MGKKSQPSPPPAPNPSQIIDAQAQANRINQYTPLGSLEFSGPMNNVATMTLDPAIQGLFNQQLGLDSGLLGAAGSALPGIQGLINSPLNTQGLPALPGDVGAYRGDVEKAFYDRTAGLLNEQFTRDENRLRQTLANQGLQSGGEAFNSEFGLFNQRRGDTFSNLARDAVLFGGQEASRQLSDQARLRSQLFGEQGALRSNQFNELAALLGLQQVQQPGLNNFFGPGQINAVDPYALQYQGLQNNYNTQSQAASQAKGAGADLLGTLAGAWIGRG